MPTNKNRPPIYIGWRTRAYSPVEMTLWSGASSMVAEAKVFSLYTKNIMRNPIAARKSW